MQAHHPPHPVRRMVNLALNGWESLLTSLSVDVNGERPIMAPEKLLRAMLLQIFYSVRSERQLMAQT